MIRPVSEIEYPPSPALLAKASMLARMEALKTSSDNLMAIIAQRIGAEKAKNHLEVAALTDEQQRLIANMKSISLA